MLRSLASLSLVAVTTSFIPRDDRVVPNDNRRPAGTLRKTPTGSSGEPG